MSYMFYGSESLLFISEWITQNITDMSFIFSGCKSL